MIIQLLDDFWYLVNKVIITAHLCTQMMILDVWDMINCPLSLAVGQTSEKKK